DPTSSAPVSGGTIYHFQHGVIYDIASGVFSVQGAMYNAFQAQGAEAAFGVPLDNGVSISFARGDPRWSQTFTKGVITLVGSSSVLTVTGPIYQQYLSVRDQVGQPLGNVITSSDGSTYQSFQNGYLYSSAARADVILSQGA